MIGGNAILGSGSTNPQMLVLGTLSQPLGDFCNFFVKVTYGQLDIFWLKLFFQT